MEDIERDLYLDILKLRTLVDAGLLSTIAANSKEAYKAPYDALASYSDLTLPYRVKKDKIVQTAGIEDKEYWVKFLAERKKQKDAEREKKQS